MCSFNKAEGSKLFNYMAAIKNNVIIGVLLYSLALVIFQSPGIAKSWI
jgi:hypothetical protein